MIAKLKAVFLSGSHYNSFHFAQCNRMKSLALVSLLINFSNTYGLSCLVTDDGKPMNRSLNIYDSNDIIEMIENF